MFCLVVSYTDSPHVNLSLKSQSRKTTNINRYKKGAIERKPGTLEGCLSDCLSAGLDCQFLFTIIGRYFLARSWSDL